MMATMQKAFLRERIEAYMFGLYPISSMTESTRLRVFSDTPSRLWTTRSTVPIETPAVRAISSIVAVFSVSIMTSDSENLNG